MPAIQPNGLHPNNLQPNSNLDGIITSTTEFLTQAASTASSKLFEFFNNTTAAPNSLEHPNESALSTPSIIGIAVATFTVALAAGYAIKSRWNAAQVNTNLMDAEAQPNRVEEQAL